MPPKPSKRKREEADDKQIEKANDEVEQSEIDTGEKSESIAKGPQDVKSAPHRFPKRARYWWYISPDEKKQGPFYPGPMRDWFHGNFFTKELLVCPSYSGEIPKKNAFLPISTWFPEPLKETAFVPAADIALYPPPPEQTRIYDITDEDIDASNNRTSREPAWLAAKLDDKRKGKGSWTGGGGPVLKGSFVN